MTNTTLIVDGNWLMMSRLYYFQDRLSKDTPDLEKESAKEDFIDFLARSIQGTLNKLHPGNLIVVADGGSWRKGLTGATTYKSRRKHTTSTDWDAVYDAFNMFLKMLEAAGITTCRAENIEGDDWCWYWSNTIYNQGGSVIIWSSDRDLTQLVRSDSGHWVLWYNDRSGVVLPESVKPSEDIAGGTSTESDILEYMMSGNYNGDLEEIVRHHEAEYINPSYIVLEKIIRGDKSDNILPIYSYQKGGRTIGIPKKMFEGVIKAANITSPDQIDPLAARKMGEYIATVCPVCNASGSVSKRILLNKRLVWLDESQYPDHIKGIFGSGLWHLKKTNPDTLKNLPQAVKNYIIP